MSNETPQLSHECPSRIELSAWLDNESSARIGDHLKTCPMCQATVEMYRQLDQAVTAAVQPSPHLATRIKAACRQKRYAAPFLFFPAMPQYIFRVAALFALLLVVSGLFIYNNRNLPGDGRNAPAPTLAAAPVPAVPAVSSAPLLPPPPVPEPELATTPVEAPAILPTDNTVNTSDIMTVNTTGDAMETAIYSYQQTQPVPDYVRHVWIVNNLTRGIKTLKEIIPSDATCEANPEAGSNRAAFVILINDRQIQSLVDGLAGSGLSLVSPTLPQPGEKQKVLATGKMMLYDVELVPGNNP